MIQVDSSNLARVGYDVKEKKLTVEFKRGGTYRYDSVEEYEYVGLLKAGSVGKYFAQRIKGRYPFEKLTEKD